MTRRKGEGIAAMKERDFFRTSAATHDLIGVTLAEARRCSLLMYSESAI